MECEKCSCLQEQLNYFKEHGYCKLCKLNKIKHIDFNFIVAVFAISMFLLLIIILILFR